jgi:hypothetical protein
MNSGTFSDQDMAMIFKVDAETYIEAVRRLAPSDSIDLVAPIYFMRSHAIELLLKAFLLAAEWKLARCKSELGHDLGKAMDEAAKAGLVLSEETKSVIRTLSPLHADYTFRYRPMKSYSFPNMSVATAALDELFEKVNIFVSAKIWPSS